ncbi:hypothetical protein ACFPN4_12490 [Ureibacillus thermophilus]
MLHINSNGEVGELAKSFNAMVASLKLMHHPILWRNWQQNCRS